jgi:MoxR-like ATPase
VRPLTSAELLAYREEVSRLYVDESVLRYVQTIAQELRKTEDLIFAASVRSVLQLIDCAKAAAYVAGRDFVLPEDVATLAPHVLGHRLCFRAGERSSTHRKEIVRHVLDRVDAPK